MRSMSMLAVAAIIFFVMMVEVDITPNLTGCTCPSGEFLCYCCQGQGESCCISVGPDCRGQKKPVSLSLNEALAFQPYQLKLSFYFVPFLPCPEPSWESIDPEPPLKPPRHSLI